MSSFTTADISWLEWPSGIESEAKIVVFVIEDTKNATLGWSTLRDDLLPSLILSLARLSSDEELHVLVHTCSGRKYPPVVLNHTSASTRFFQEIKCFEDIDTTISSRLIMAGLQSLDSYSSYFEQARCHLVLVAFSTPIHYSYDGELSWTSVANDLFQKNISLHAYMKHSQEMNDILGLFAYISRSKHCTPQRAIEFPIGTSSSWTYQTTIPREAPSIGSIDLDSGNFSPDSIALDHELFQSASSAQILQDSEQYDWGSIMAYLSPTQL